MSTFLFQINQVETEVSCEFQSASCKVKGLEQELNIEVTPFPIKVEESIRFAIEMEKGVSFESGWIQGVNMYMGRIPVLPVSDSENNTVLELETFLGSCSEPNMRWQMILTFVDNQGVQFQRFINFETTIY